MKNFRCVRCGNCCRWSGCVKIAESEIDAIASYLGISPEEFLEHWTALMPDRQGLTLIEKANGSCILLEDGSPAKCKINPVKPEQCRRFPQYWNFPNWEEQCMAINTNNQPSDLYLESFHHG